eukprot:1928100-Rhodomonas_salina.1
MGFRHSSVGLLLSGRGSRAAYVLAVRTTVDPSERIPMFLAKTTWVHTQRASDCRRDTIGTAKDTRHQRTENGEQTP